MTFVTWVLSSVIAAASPVTDGTIAISGNGCYGDMKIVSVAGEKNRYELPIKIILDKKSKTPFERKTCNMRLPLSFKSNRKIQVSDISQTVNIDGAGVKSTLNISVVGKKSKTLSTSTSKTLVSEGLVVESECGKDLILTGDLNVVAAGSEIVSAKTEPVQITLKIINCK